MGNATTTRFNLPGQVLHYYIIIGTVQVHVHEVKCLWLELVDLSSITKVWTSFLMSCPSPMQKGKVVDAITVIKDVHGPQAYQQHG